MSRQPAADLPDRPLSADVVHSHCPTPGRLPLPASQSGAGTEPEPGRQRAGADDHDGANPVTTAGRLVPGDDPAAPRINGL